MKRTNILILPVLFLFIFAIFIPSNICAQSLDPAWALNFGENYSHNANSIVQTEDGGYIIAGAGYLITKLNTSGALEWQKIYTLNLDGPDEAHCIEETQGGGLIVAGTSSSYYNDKMWILKLDPSGNTEWQKLTTYSGEGFRARAYSIKETLDRYGDPDGYVVVGTTIHLTGGSWRLWVLRIDLDGTINWQKTFKLHTSGAYSIEQTFDSEGTPTGYIVAGSTGYYGNDAWLLKLKLDGSVDWQKIYGMSSQNANCIQQTVDGGFIVTGPGTADELAPGRHFWVAKLDSSGSFTNGWQRVYGGQEGEDVPFSIQEVVDFFGNPDGYVVAGETTNFGAGQKDVWIIKIDNDGNIEWEKTYGGSQYDSAQSIKQTFDQFGNPSGYIVAGYTWSYGTGRDAFVLKINVNGEIPECSHMSDSVAVVSEGDYWFHDIPSAFEEEVSDAALIDTNANITEENFQPQVICYWEPTAFSPVTPCRIVDTRKAEGAFSQGEIRGYYARGSVVSQGGNSAGCPAPSGDALGLVLNVTAVPISGNGNLSVFPYEASVPNASLVNYKTGVQNVANSTTVKSCYLCGRDISIKNSYGIAHVVVDVMGYFYPDGALLFSPVKPCRIIDTRKAGGALTPGEIRGYNVEGPVASQGGNPDGCPAPASGAKSAVINVTAVPVANNGNFRVFPQGESPPHASLVNYKTGVQNIANSTTVKTCPDCVNDISIQSNYGTAHLVVDVMGYYYPAGELKFASVEPCRIVDTRKAGGALLPGEIRSYHAHDSVAPQGGNPDGCPAPAGDSDGLVVNVTVVPVSGSGNIKVYPHNSTPPNASLVNYKTGVQNIANSTTVKSCNLCGRDISIQNSYGNAHVIIDVMGYYYDVSK